MNHHYNDITSRIEEPPKWYDEYAVPRYCEFGPDEGANIYAAEIALVEIACQNCGAKFAVAFSWTRGNLPLHDRIQDGTIHYGDPPNMGCCSGGPTMNCEDLRVLEFWMREGFDAQRVPEMEVELPDAALYEPPAPEAEEV